MKKRVKKLVLLAITLGVMRSSFSQKGELHLSIEGGMNMPMGNYGSIALSNPLSMFANSGGIFEPTLGYFITKNISVNLGYSYSRNSVNHESFYNQYLSTHANSIGYNLIPKNMVYDIPVPYENNGVYLGLGTHFTKGKKERLVLQAKIQLGINSYFISQQSSVLFYDDPSGLEEREELKVGSVYGTGFSFLISRGAGYKISNRLGTYINLEFCSTRYSYSANYVRTELDNSNIYFYEEGKINVDSPVSWFNFNGGLYFSIIKSKS